MIGGGDRSGTVRLDRDLEAVEIRTLEALESNGDLRVRLRRQGMTLSSALDMQEGLSIHTKCNL